MSYCPVHQISSLNQYAKATLELLGIRSSICYLPNEATFRRIPGLRGCSLLAMEIGGSWCRACVSLYAVHTTWRNTFGGRDVAADGVRRQGSHDDAAGLRVRRVSRTPARELVRDCLLRDRCSWVEPRRSRSREGVRPPRLSPKGPEGSERAASRGRKLPRTKAMIINKKLMGLMK